jgi:hypothetical protein
MMVLDRSGQMFVARCVGRDRDSKQLKVSTGQLPCRENSRFANVPLLQKLTKIRSFLESLSSLETPVALRRKENVQSLFGREKSGNDGFFSRDEREHSRSGLCSVCVHFNRDFHG